MWKKINVFLMLFAVLVFPVCSTPASADNNINATGLQNVIDNAAPGYNILGNGTYILNGPVYMRSNVVLVGSGDTRILAGGYTNFDNKGDAMIHFDGVTNAGIKNIIIDGGESKNQYDNSGKDWENAIGIGGGSSDIVLTDITFVGLLGDGVRGYNSGSSRVRVDNCTFNRVGHDGVQDWYGDNWVITNNYFNLYINSGVRIANANDCVIYGNFFTSDTGSGFAGVELEDDVTGTDIINNDFNSIHSNRGIGVVTVHAYGKINMWNNTFFDCPGGNLAVDGIDITNVDTSGKYSFGDSNEFKISNESDVIKKCEDKITDVSTDIKKDIRRLIRVCFNQSSADMSLSSAMLNASSVDAIAAYDLVSGTPEEKALAAELLNESEKKAQMSNDLYNMSLNQNRLLRENVKNIM